MLPSGLLEHVADAEPLARFLTSDSQFNSTGAKPAAFLPGPIDTKTSVFRQGPQPADALWETADREIGVIRRVRAAAVLTTAAVRQAQLDVESHEPPPRHANLVGWPSTSDEADRRAQQRERALLLCQAAELIRR